MSNVATTGRYLTPASVWIVQAEARMVARVPRKEDGRHALVGYDEVGRPASYEAALLERGRLVVIFPDGATVVSGPIEEAPA